VGDARSSESEEERYHNRFTAVAADVQWRPRRTLPRPRIRGIQTAIVTGPAGEEIHTDEHGRVKCQFHWDRLGTMDDHSSCWIRVMQTWAGNGWGTWILPRIGMEVIVSFVDGDPDRPVVTGCLYNGDNRPPYSLPEQKTKSTYKSNSSLGGGGYNEFRFEDKKGDEEIFTHAQRDYNEVVEHDHNTLVHNCQTNTVDIDQTENIHQNQFLTVDINRTKNVGLNETTNIGQTRNETVGLDEFIMITQHRSKMVGANETVMVGQNRTESVGESEKVLVGSDRHIRVIGANQLEVNRHIHVTSDEKIMLRAGVSTILIKK
jgi:type VI secretion system secreted protein VgrG